MNRAPVNWRLGRSRFSWRHESRARQLATWAIALFVGGSATSSGGGQRKWKTLGEPVR
jgi:hypothetical protein